jgi:hypothetical protein
MGTSEAGWSDVSSPLLIVLVSLQYNKVADSTIPDPFAALR